MDIALLLLRAVLGLYLVGHGTQKLFGWFGGPGLKGTTGFMTMLGFRPAPFWAVNVALAETVGGILVVAGLLSPLGALAIAATMAVAIIVPHGPKGVWGQNGGFELPLINLAIAVALALIGPGRYALDTALGIALPEPATGIVVTALAVIGVAASLVSRKLAPAAQEQHAPAA